jgi:hypothetical protein
LKLRPSSRPAMRIEDREETEDAAARLKTRDGKVTPVTG